jgi:enterochelin esterase-like enzyme
VKTFAWLVVGLVLALSAQPVSAQVWRKDSSDLAVVNKHLRGKIVDYTANHGHDNRIWSRSLHQRRDLYVYLPPNFDPHQRYPIVLLLHGFAQDEQMFLKLAPMIDAEMHKGKLPPCIVAVPDGSITGEPCYTQPATFFINSNAGNFEDFVLQDVWDFMTRKYPIHEDRKAHVLAGVSMGGCAAYNLGIRNRNAFGVVAGIHAPLNLRWVDQNGYYMANFDPRYWGWRTTLTPRDRNEVVANFAGGLVKLRLYQFVDPLFGEGDEALENIARENPIEMVQNTGLRNGELSMYIGYGGKDEFNIDAQVESFLYLCKHRGLGVAVGYEPNGRHDMGTANRLWPGLVEWLGPQLAPYAPGH